MYFRPSLAKFEAALLPLVASGKDDDLNFALEVLSNYHGEPALHDTCKAIVEALPEDDKRLDKMEIILESTGTVTGEFGMVHAYQGKKEEVKGWLNRSAPKGSHIRRAIYSHTGP